MIKPILSAAAGRKADEAQEPVAFVAPARQRHGLLFGLFCVWLLSMPFHRFSLVATYSFDNLVAPLLCMAFIALPSIRNPAIAYQRQQTLIVLTILYCLFWLASVLPVLGSDHLALERGWRGLRDAFYLFAVLLYVRDRSNFRIIKSLVVVVTIVAAVTTLLDSLGVIHLPVERYEASRVGLEWLPKAIGLFSSYGDVAMLSGFTAVVMISHNRAELAFGLGSRWGKTLVWLSLLAGFAGTQSRNVVLTVLAAMAAYWMLGALSRARGAMRMAITGVLLTAGISVLGILAVFGGDIADMLTGWGGANASQSATWRLQSYDRALMMIAQHPILGLTVDAYDDWGSYLVATLHNMWLRVFLQGGVFRFAALVGFIWVVAKGGLIRPGADRGAIRDASVVMATVAAILIATQFYGGLSEIMWIMLGLLASYRWVSREAAPAGVQ